MVRAIRHIILIFWKNLVVLQIKHRTLTTVTELVLPALLSYLYINLSTVDPTEIEEHVKNTTRRLRLPNAIVRYLSAYPVRFLVARQDQPARKITPRSNVTHVVTWSEIESPSAFVIAMFPLVVVLIIPFPTFVYRVGYELYNGLKNFLIMNGMSNGIYWTGTFLVEFLKVFLIMVPVVVLWNYDPKGGPALFEKTSLEVQISIASLFCSASVGNALLVAAVTPRPAVSAASMVVLSLSTLVLPIVAIIGTNMQNTNFMRYLQLLSCLCPHVALCYALACMFMHENFGPQDRYLDWRNLHEVGLQDVTLSKVMHAMLASFLSSILLCVYIDKVWPYAHDFPESPWFFLQAAFWGANKIPDHHAIRASLHEQASPLVEPVAHSVKPYIILHHISKTIDSLSQKKEILHSINLKLFDNHVTVLLGRNCSGKTLIIKIITGSTRPTGGNVFLSAFSVLSEGHEIRKLLGVCPQNVALYDAMTIKENLQFFAGVREMHTLRPRDEVNLALLEYQFYTTRKTRVHRLTYGQKRRLQLAIALLGTPEYIILDEPTRGVDMETRRTLWEVIMKIRQTRGVLVVTSSVDEADVLADRIAIVTSGVITICGSPTFLRKQHGAGYRLSVVFRDVSQKSHVSELVDNILSAPLLVESRMLAAYNIGYPNPDKLIYLLKQLEENQQQLGISYMGISTTSLDDVLLKFVAAPTEFDYFDYKNTLGARNETPAKRVIVPEDVPLLLYQVDALTRKKATYLARSFKISIFMKLLQIAFMVVLERFFENEAIWMRLQRLTLSNITLQTRSAANVATVFYDYDWVSQELHSVVYSARALAAFAVPLSLSIVTAVHVFLSVEERVTGAKQVQFMAGLTPERFWTVTFCADMIQHLVGTLAAVVPLAIPADTSLSCHDFSYTGPMFCLLFMYGWCFVPVCYIVSLIVDQEMTAYFWLVLSSLLFGTATNCYTALIGPSTISNFRPPDFMSEVTEYVMVPLRLLPQFAVAHGAGQVQMYFFERAACCHLPPDLLLYTCQRNQKEYPVEQRQYMELVKICCRANCGESDCTFITSETTFSSQSYFWDIALMFLSGILYLTLVISWERRPETKNYIRNLLEPLHIQDVARTKKQVPIQANVRHPTVLDEQDLVEAVIDQFRSPEVRVKPGGLVMDGVSFEERGQYFPDMYLYVAPREIFGIVGRAQSGRSTVLRAAAGMKNVLSGHLYMNGIDLANQRAAYMKQIGYCPQTNPLISKLTVREMLTLLARLRGLNPQQVEEEVSFATGIAGLLRVQQISISLLSSSQKRQLSIGMALVGDASLLILDEPLQDVDPVSRLGLIKNLQRVQASHNLTVLIASHRAAVCETLCDRVAFLSDGEFAAIGSPTELRKDVGQRFIVMIRLTVHQTTKGDFFKQVNREIKVIFPTSVITDVRKDQLTYRVKDAVIPWSQVFEKMERLKETLRFEDYVVNEDTLGEVFLGFTHERKVVDFGAVEAIRYMSTDPPMLIKKPSDSSGPSFDMSESML
ncbi:phospholipid-transporting ATPase ABCA3-like [Ornithodoros turicata]|uniref:phospholipid-transporting ATPase ABCA3-like n=1 Tax=Ornithodoros turicata TaxID=34597 RepID=UPI003139B8D8